MGNSWIRKLSQKITVGNVLIKNISVIKLVFQSKIDSGQSYSDIVDIVTEDILNLNLERKL